MERLTYRHLDSDGTLLFDKDCISGTALYERFTKEQAVHKLCAYEDLEEQNRLITLPCAVGQTLYAILNGHIHKFQYEYESDIVFDMRKDDKFGKTVFLTESEAQQVLEKISGGENE